MALAGAAGLASASDSSSLKIPFANLGVDINATATLNAQFGSRSSALSFKAAHHTPGESYTFNVWEVARFTATADARGRWQVTFGTPVKRGTQLLDFDPRAQVVSLSQGTNVLLETVVSRPGEPAAEFLIYPRPQMGLPQTKPTARQILFSLGQGFAPPCPGCSPDAVRPGAINQP